MKAYVIAATALLGLGLCTSMPTVAAECALVEANVKAELGAMLPAGVVINKIRIDGTRVYVDGTSPSNAMVSQFLRALTTAPEFDLPELIEVSTVNGRIAYQLMTKVRCPD